MMLYGDFLLRWMWTLPPSQAGLRPFTTPPSNLHHFLMSIAIFGSAPEAIQVRLIRLRAGVFWTLCGRQHLGYGDSPLLGRWMMKSAHSYCVGNCTEPSRAVVESARNTDLISADDRALLKELLSASEREGVPAHKAGVRGVQSTKGFTFAAVALVASMYVSGIESEFATHSVICKKAGEFFGELYA